MIEEKKFCVCCGQKINTNLLSSLMKRKYYEFADGWYCETCAREKVNKERKKLK
jgi:hypothetical protein